MGVMLHGGTRAPRRARLTRPRDPHAISTSPAAPGAEVGVSPRILAGFAVLLPLAFSTATYAVYWAPKAALVLLTLPAGIATLTVLARRRIPGARAAAGFVVVSGVSALISDRPILALVGAHNWGTGWLFVAAIVGLWALGVRVGRSGGSLVQAGVMAGALASATFGWLQVVVGIPVEVLAPIDGRASALLGNAVHLGALAGGALVMAAVAVRGSAHPRRWYAAAVVLGGAVQMSGSRAGLAVTVLVALAAVVRAGWRRGAPFTAAMVAGIVLATVVPTNAPRTTASDRALVSADGGSSARFGVWRASLDAIGERPLLGWGPGRLQSAVSPRIGAEVVRAQGGSGEFVDAHNWLVEYGVTTGLLGLGLMMSWVVAAARGARGPLAAFALTGGLVGLLQPQSVAMTPLVALALGTAMGSEWAPPRPFAGRAMLRAVSAGTALAVIAAASLIIGEVALARAALDFRHGDVDLADRTLPPWPTVQEVEWRLLAFGAIDDGTPESWDRAIEAAREAALHDPAAHGSWGNLAALFVAAGREAEARPAYERALEQHPWSVSALDGLIRLAHDGGEDDLVAELCARRQEIVDAECLADVRAPPG